MTFFPLPATPASLSVSMFCWASIWKTNSLPRRRAGSPVQASAGPSTANLTPATCSSSAMALVVFLARSSRAPAQPTQNRYSTSVGDGSVDDRDLEVELGDPVGAAVLGHAPRVALALQVVQHRRRLGRERGLDQDLVAAHAVDVVDVLDVDRALVHAGAAVGAGPQHLRVDDAVLRRRADQRPGGLGEDVGGQGVALLLAGEQVGRLGERVVAQVQDELLGGQRLAGRPGRALRLAAAALGAGAQVEHALPGEVLDLADAEHVGVGVGLLEVEHLPVAAHGLERAEGVGTAGEQDVQRGEADVQVLGVGHDHQERQHDAELREDEDDLEHAVDPVAQGVQDLRDHPGRERPGVRVREHAGVLLRAPVDQQRDDDRGDHAEHHPGGAGVRAEEPRPAAFLVRVVAQPDDRERDDAGQHADREQVLDEADALPSARCHGIANVRENSAPYASMIVSSSTMKPQNVAAWAAPGTDHFSSLRCPNTSVSWVLPLGRVRPGVLHRSGAGWPDIASRFSHHSRRPATANAATVSPRPTTIRTIMRGRRPVGPRWR